ncbi:MAG: hypothetical protein ACK5H2_12100, partial [Beutenbergiaceae bacterium]
MTGQRLLIALASADALQSRLVAGELGQDERWAVLARAASTSPLAVELLVEELDGSGTVRRFVGRSLIDQNAIDDVCQDT